MATKWSTSSPKVDLVFSCITDMKDDGFLENLPEFCKHVGKPGSYVFLILTVVQFVNLGEAFKDKGFKVAEHPFDIVYDTSTVQRKVMSDFPQRHSDIALICRYPGDHPDGFHPFHRNVDPDVSMQLHESGDSSLSSGDFDCRAHFASFINVSACRRKLKRPRSNAAFFSWEKNCELVTRIVQTFCPFQGLVIDPFPGPLTTALACFKSKRSCISVSAKTDGFKYARGRLRIHAATNATLEELEDYSRTAVKNAETLQQPTVEMETTVEDSEPPKQVDPQANIGPLTPSQNEMPPIPSSPFKRRRTEEQPEDALEEHSAAVDLAGLNGNFTMSLAGDEEEQEKNG